MKVEIEKKRYLLGNVYGPNKDDPEFFYQFLARVQAYTADYLLLGGDFNTVLDYTVDRSNMLKHGNNGAAEYINSCIEMTELIDIWRELYPDRHGYTWHRRNPYYLHERLDFFLISDSLQQMVENIEIIPGLRSDHSLVKLTVAIQAFERGPGFWKFNTMLLNDSEYVEKLMD